MSLIGTLNTAVSGMTVSQVGINTTSHNLANVNTPGYVRQRVELETSRPLSQKGLGTNTLGVGQIGTGVSANSIIRIKNSFYDYQFRSESPSYGATVSKYNYLTNIETVFNEPSDTSISATLNNFFNSFNELAKDPNSLGAKNIVVESSKHLANSLNKIKGSIDNLQKECTKEQETLLQEVNKELSDLKELEKQIKIVQNAGDNPNDLMDRRDKILDSLSSKIDLNNANIDAALKDGSLTLDEIKQYGIDGAIKGLQDVEEQIKGYSKQLGTLMSEISKQVNELYKDGLSGADAKDFFTLELTNGEVSGISVNKEFTEDASNIKMTSEKADSLMKLKTKGIQVDGKDTSLMDYYMGIVQDIGHNTQNIKKLEENQSKLLNNIDTNRWNIASVSQDEELVNLMQYQHAYSASAKVVSTVDNLLDVVINGLIR